MKGFYTTAAILLLSAIAAGFFGYQQLAPQEQNVGTLSVFTSAQLATGADNGDCLTTNGTANSWSASCGGIGGEGIGDPFTHPSAGISATTSALLVNNATSTFTNLNVFFATTTNATSTSLFATTASTTNFFGAGLNTCQAGSVLTYNGSGKFGCATDSTGSSAFEIATTSGLNVPDLAYFTKTSGKTTLGSVATGTISSANSALTVTGNRSAIGGAAVFTVATTTNAMFTGSAGQTLAYTSSGWIGQATTTFSNGTGVTLTYSNGAVTGALASMSAGVLGTPATGIPSAQATSTLYGASTGGYVLTWSNGGLVMAATSTCAQITGSAALCDGDDASGGSGASFGQSWEIDALGQLAPTTTLAVSIPTWLSINDRTLAYASSTNSATLFGIDAGGDAATTSATQTYATAFGNGALAKNGTGGLGNTAVGYQAGSLISTGDNNVTIGTLAGNTITSSARNVIIGSNANLETSANGNILIGAYVSMPANNGQLNIGNVLFGRSMYNGTVSSGAPTVLGQIAVGSTSPFSQFAIHANNGSPNTTLFAIGSSTASATTTLFTITNTGNVFASSSMYVGTGDPTVDSAISTGGWTFGHDVTDGSFAIASGTTLGTNNALTINAFTRTLTYSYGSTTALSISGSASTTALVVSNVRSALHLAGADGTVSAYAGGSCTSNQVLTAITATGGCTSAAITGAYFGNVTANSILGNVSGSSAAPSFLATSTSLFTGTVGQFPIFTGTNSLFGTSTIFASTASLVGISSTTPYAVLSVGAPAARVAFSIGTSSELMKIDASGKLVVRDIGTGLTGVVSPLRSFVLTSGTTTTWTASTTGSAYSPFIVAPFAGTLQQVRCLTDAVGLGVNTQIAGSDVTPQYILASTTAGIMKFTAGNTFTAGQKIQANFGTTTTSTAKSVSCTFQATETP